MSYEFYNGKHQGRCNKGKKSCKKCHDVIEPYDQVGACNNVITSNDCVPADLAPIIPYASGGVITVYLATTSVEAPVGTINPDNDVIDSLGVIGFGHHESISPVAISADAIGINFSSDVSGPPIRLYNFSFVAPRNGCLRNLAVTFNNLLVSTLTLPSNAVINCVAHIFIAGNQNNIFVPTVLRTVVPVAIPVVPQNLGNNTPSQPIFLAGPFSGINYVDVQEIQQGTRILLVAYLVSGPNIANTSMELETNISAGVVFA